MEDYQRKRIRIRVCTNKYTYTYNFYFNPIILKCKTKFIIAEALLLLVVSIQSLDRDTVQQLGLFDNKIQTQWRKSVWHEKTQKSSQRTKNKFNGTSSNYIEVQKSSYQFEFHKYTNYTFWTSYRKLKIWVYKNKYFRTWC